MRSKIHENNEYRIVFRKAYGDINIRKDVENTLSLAFIVEDENDESNEYLSQQSMINNISFNSDEITVSEFSMVKSLIYKNNAYYFLNLKLTPSNDFEDELKINTIRLGDSLYDIGDLTLRLASDNEGDLEVSSRRALSFGKGIANFAASVRNNSIENIKILNINNGNMEKLDNNIIIKSEEDEIIFNEYGNIIMNSNEVFEIIVKFDKNQEQLYNAYYISPIIEYEDSTGMHSLNFNYYVAGLNISKEEFKMIVSE